MTTNEMKWKISIFSMCLFILVTNKTTYNLTNNIFSNLLNLLNVSNVPNVLDENDNVTTIGYVLHVIIFLLLVRYSMELNLFK